MKRSIEGTVLHDAERLGVALDPPALVVVREDIDGHVDRLRVTIDDLAFLAQHIPQVLRSLVAAREAELDIPAEVGMGLFLPATEIGVARDLVGGQVLITIRDRQSAAIDAQPVAGSA